MPLILRTEAEFSDWLEGDLMGAVDMQRPLPDDVLLIVARGEKQRACWGMIDIPALGRFAIVPEVAHSAAA
jgi:hypothetical protein